MLSILMMFFSLYFKWNLNLYISMKFEFFWIQKTAFYIAVEKGNIDMIKLLLNSERIDINIKTI